MRELTLHRIIFNSYKGDVLGLIFENSVWSYSCWDEIEVTRN